MLGFSPLAAAPLGDDGEAGSPFSLPIVAGAAVVGTATVAQTHAFTAVDVTSTVTVSSPALTSAAPTDALTSVGIETTVTVSTATVAQTHALAAVGVSSGAPSIGAPVLTVFSDLAATGVESAVTVGASAITQTHALTDTDLDSTISVGAATLGQEHTLSAAPVVSGAVDVGAAQIAQTHVLGASQITAGAAVVATSTIRQTHGLVSTNLTGSAVAFLPPGPRLRNRWALTPSNIVVGQPVVQTITLVEFLAARRRHVSVTLSADIQPVRDWGTEVSIAPSANTVVIEVDGTIVEVYDGANFAAADNANSATGAYIGQNKAE